MADKKTTGYSGLPWPEEYERLLPVIRRQWDIGENIFLNRKLSGGKSGALVYAADVESHRFTGQAILKLEMTHEPAGMEGQEADLHRRAIAEAPDFAAAHLPKLVSSLRHENQSAFLSTIAGRGLEYVESWSTCAFEQQMSVVRRLSKDLLEDWNADYKLSSGMHTPQQILKGWLGYRLDPDEGGRIHEFLSETCGIAPDEASITFEGNWYPNPLTFAVEAEGTEEQLRIRTITGHCHGDLHGLNLLVEQSPSSEPNYYLIDLELYEPEQFLFYDHAYFELTYLLTSRGTATSAYLESILEQLHHSRLRGEKSGLRADDLGLIELVRALRLQVMDWIDEHEGERLAPMESQYLLARVACGLSFCHKRISEETRRMAFIYAASNLKEFLVLNRLDWPKHGPPFVIENDAGRVEPPDQAGAIAAPESPTTSDVPRNTQLATDATDPDDHRGNGSNDSGDQPIKRWRPGDMIYEFRRRHVVTVAGLYIVVAWLSIQAVSLLKTGLGLPAWTETLIAVLLAIGFPIACIFAWAFERSPDGLQPTQPTQRKDGRNLPGRGIVDYVAAAGIIVILAIIVGRQGVDFFSANPITEASQAELKSIAVLPFRNLDTDQDSDDFSDGLTIEIMNTLSKTGKFRIPGKTSSFQYKTQSEDLRDIGKELGVDYILEGSVRRFEDQLRIEAQLVQADDGFLVWSNNYDQKMGDIFEIQQGIANSIGHALDTPLGVEAADLQTDRTDHPEAYGLYLKGLALLYERGPGVGEAVGLLDKSVTVEPTFAAGWAALSLAYDIAPSYVDEVDGHPVVASVYYRKAHDAALQAEKIDPDLPIVLHALGNTLRRLRQWSAAEDKYREALDAEPNGHRVMKDYSQLLGVTGHFSRAKSMVDQMLYLDPLNPLYEFIQALYVWQSEPDEQSINALITIFETHPEFDQLAFRTILGSLAEAGQLDRARSLLTNCGSCDPTWRDRALSLIEAIGTQSPETIFENYKNDRFVSYQTFFAIGGAQMVLQAFQYDSLRADSQLQLFVEPWALVDIIGTSATFKEITEDMGLVEYWRTRGWPDSCRPVGDADFGCGQPAGTAENADPAQK